MQVINVVDKYVAENNNLKVNLEELTYIRKQTYAEAAALHKVAGKSAPPAEQTDAKAKSEVPITSVILIYTLTQSACVKSANIDEDIYTGKEGGTMSRETSSVPDAGQSSAAASNLDVNRDRGTHYRE